MTKKLEHAMARTSGVLREKIATLEKMVDDEKANVRDLVEQLRLANLEASRARDEVEEMRSKDRASYNAELTNAANDEHKVFVSITFDGRHPIRIDVGGDRENA